MKKLKLYLAHNLDTRHEIRKWELQVEKKYKINLLNPFYDSKRSDIDKLDSGKITRWQLNDRRCHALVKRDLKMVDKCEGILAFVTHGVIGTMLEIGYARATGKKIFVISKDYIMHPWIRVYANYRFATKEEFEEWLKLTPKE
jgi:nucleoside 2-deoxyribosyltransferase